MKKGGSLKVAILGELPALDIMFTTATVTGNVRWAHVRDVVRPELEHGSSTAPGGKGEVSGDAKTWTFSLRKGIQFHNGKEMKSADVVPSPEAMGWRERARRGHWYAARGERW
jgi:peptide/nickel transport system substrate-binding protein